MSETVRSSQDNPCHHCPDRYTACADKCTKPERLKWKAKQEKIRNARRQNSALWGYTADQIRKNRRKR